MAELKEVHSKGLVEDPILYLNAGDQYYFRDVAYEVISKKAFEQTPGNYIVTANLREIKKTDA